MSRKYIVHKHLKRYRADEKNTNTQLIDMTTTHFRLNTTECLGQATTKRARSLRKHLISSPFMTPTQPYTTLPTPIKNDNSKMHSITTNDHQTED